MDNVTDINGQLEAQRKNDVLNKIQQAFDDCEMNRAEILGVLEIAKMNIYAVWQAEDLEEFGDDDE